MEAAGKQMSSCGGSIVAIGCSGFVLLVIVLVAIAILDPGGSTTTHPVAVPHATQEAEHTNEAANEVIREGKKLEAEGRKLEAEGKAIEESAKPAKPSGLYGDQTKEENEEAGCKYGFTARERSGPSGPEYFCNTQKQGQELQENREKTGE